MTAWTPWTRSLRSLANGSCVEWHSMCASNECVEWHDTVGTVQFRDSKDPDGPVLSFSPAARRAFTVTLKGAPLRDLLASGTTG